MTPADALAALPGRCEAATGADREIDRTIALTVLGWRVEVDTTVYVSGDPVDYWYDPAGYCQGHQPPLFTASLDAAMSLVPEGLWRRIAIDSNGRANVRLGDACAVTAATPALALCAAAIRARATTGATDHVE